MERLERWNGEARPPVRSWIPALLMSSAVVAWEYLLSAAMNSVDWNAQGVAAHMALDLAMILPVAWLALAAGRRLARRMGLRLDEWSGLLGTSGLIALLTVAAMVPVVAARDQAHEWMGQRYGLSLAEVQITQVRPDETTQAAKQLCSFTSLRNPSFAGRLDDFEVPLAFRIESAAGALLTQLAILLPLLLAGLFLRRRADLPKLDFAPQLALLAWGARTLRKGTVRAGALAALALVWFCYGTGVDKTFAQPVAPGLAPYNACTAGGPVKEFDVHAINVEITMNRYADRAPGFMYALEANIPAIRTFEAALAATRARLAATANVNLDEPGLVRVTPGLRKDPIQPLVIRANMGDCVRIHLTNDVTDGFPASIHLLGLSHTVTNAGGAVGVNPVTYATSGATITYEIPIPKDPGAERAYYFHDHGAGTSNLNNGGRNRYRERQGMGLFGALVVEPEGSTYLDVETGAPLDTVTGSSWEAIIIDPNLAGRPDGKNFREFVVMYHEFGHENFRALFDFTGAILPHLDGAALSGVYRIGARAINYRSEPFRRRIELSNLVNGTAVGAIRNGKALGYASYPFGDPPTPIPRSYLGEATKMRVMHAGAEVFHVHHLHGGGDRWRRNPDADPNSNFWSGLTKVPKPDLKSIHLDSQSIGPGGSYNMESECGAGGCQQGEGEYLFHCHIGHHYIAGMWSFWRVHATVQTAENDIHGHGLYVEPRLYQSNNVFSDTEAPSNTPPLAGVSAGALIGLQVDWNRTIVADAAFTNPLTQVRLTDWIANQLPPQGVPFDNNDATVWNWTTLGAADASYQVLGEPEETRAMANWKSSAPGTRPEVLFNPKNGRYAWPLFRPHAAARPPFTARHSGAPWLGENMIPGRMDGLCANNLVHPEVFVGLRAQRYYPLTAITLPIQVTKAPVPRPPGADRSPIDPNGMLYVLNEDKADVLAGLKPADPLAIRSNVGDCVELIFTSEIPDGPLNNNWSKVNVHSHFVQFDTQASDGVISGFSYEQAVRPYATEGRTLTEAVAPLSTTLKVTNTTKLRVGIWLGIGLGEGTCGSLLGQPYPCTEIRKIAAIPDANTIVLDQPVLLNHAPGQAVGVEFVRYNWYSDVDVGTVFFHTHVESKDWDHGLFGAHIVEPKGSTYHDPATGAEIRSGTLADIHVPNTLLGRPVADGVKGSFRELMMFVHNQNPVVGGFDFGGGTINLRAEPWVLRPGDPAYRFSSVTHGDPFTPEIRAYAGDPVVVRGLGLVEKQGGIRMTGHRFNIERFNKNSDLRDATYVGISERFDFSLEGGAGGPKKFPGDYLYYSTLARDFESGAWGLMRVYDQAKEDLQPLPGVGFPSGTTGFPTLSQTGAAPPSLADGPGAGCPAGAARKTYDLSIADTSIIYNDATPGVPGVAYFLNGTPVTDTRTPMVVRVNKGQCLRINLTNLRATKRSGFAVGELLFDPQRSYGTAVGLNYDSTVAPGATRTYEYYADKDLGLTLALNLADGDSLALGAWGGVVVEKEGSTYRSPGTLSPLPGDGAGIQADIVKNGLATREFVALMMDAEDELGQDRMPYPDKPEFLTNSISYSNEPLDLRNFLLGPADVFRSPLFGDPRHVVALPKGASLIYRVGQPWGEMPHVPALEGHRYRQEPGMPGSEVLNTDVLAPGMTLNMEYLGGAGGDLQAPGDYLYLDRQQPFVQAGMWHIVRVTDGAGSLSAPDSVTVTRVETRPGKTTVRGVVGIKPAGDTVPRLQVFSGGQAGGRCTGTKLGTIPVNTGSGRFRLDLAQPPSVLCLQSPGGGIASGPITQLVTEQTLARQAFLADRQRTKRLALQFEREFAELEEQEGEER